VRRSARSTQVERALRARFRLRIQSRRGSRSFRFNSFTAPGRSALWGGFELENGPTPALRDHCRYAPPLPRDI
jgi:hypothetical protein